MSPQDPPRAWAGQLEVTDVLFPSPSRSNARMLPQPAVLLLMAIAMGRLADDTSTECARHLRKIHPTRSFASSSSLVSFAYLSRLDIRILSRFFPAGNTTFFLPRLPASFGASISTYTVGEGSSQPVRTRQRAPSLARSSTLSNAAWYRQCFRTPGCPCLPAYSSFDRCFEHGGADVQFVGHTTRRRDHPFLARLPGGAGQGRSPPRMLGCILKHRASSSLASVFSIF
jgi:hypothetical protein